MDINFNARDPVYIQVVHYFKEQIATGRFEPNQEIPSRRELAKRLKINPNTVQRAYKEMEEQKLIYTEGNLPSRITRDDEVLKVVRKELIIEAVDSLIDSIRAVNVPLEDILDYVKDRYYQGGQADD